MDDETYLLQLFYCNFGVMLFLMGTGWVNFSMLSKVRNYFSATQKRINDLQAEIQQHCAEQAKMPIMDQFAANRKKQRVIDKLTDDLQELIKKRDQEQMASGLVWALLGKGLCLSLGLYLANKSADLSVITLSCSYFYPLNFLLSYPTSSPNPAETNVSLFSFVVLCFIVIGKFHQQVVMGGLKRSMQLNSKLN